MDVPHSSRAVNPGGCPAWGWLRGDLFGKVATFPSRRAGSPGDRHTSEDGVYRIPRTGTDRDRGRCVLPPAQVAPVCWAPRTEGVLRSRRGEPATALSVLAGQAGDFDDRGRAGRPGGRRALPRTDEAAARLSRGRGSPLSSPPTEIRGGALSGAGKRGREGGGAQRLARSGRPRVNPVRPGVGSWQFQQRDPASCGTVEARLRLERARPLRRARLSAHGGRTHCG